MVADLVRAILERAAAARYQNDNGEPIKLVVGLDNGVVYRGHVIDPGEWVKINTVGGAGAKIVEGRVREVPGSWPSDTSYVPGGDQFDMIFMTMVEFLSGDRWVSGCSVAVDTHRVVFCGDQYF